jgi:hypothetical protein
VRTGHRFVEPHDTVVCRAEDGTTLAIPVVLGILKHPSAEQLSELLTDVVVVRKYTHEALRRAPWSALRRFPRDWLVSCIEGARLPDGRRRALEFMLRLDEAAR